MWIIVYLFLMIIKGEQEAPLDETEVINRAIVK